MKNLKFLFILLVSLSMLSVGCDKNNDPADPVTNYKGSFSVKINGTNYNTLKSDVAEMDEGVTFFADDKNGGQFQIAIPNVPAVGETITLGLDVPDDATIVMVANGPIEGYVTLIAGTGTVKRETNDKYTLSNIILYGGSFFAEEFPMSGTITVGKHATK
jgi:hypothetical protein